VLTAENDARRDVIRWAMRLIDYGKGGPDPELDGLSLGQVADRIIACVIPPEQSP
jgi:hypothetical protein